MADTKWTKREKDYFDLLAEFCDAYEAKTPLEWVIQLSEAYKKAHRITKHGRPA